MSLFKQRLRRLLGETLTNTKFVDDPIDTIYLASSRKHSPTNKVIIKIPNKKQHQLSHNNSLSNINTKGPYTKLFTVDNIKYERNSHRLNSLVRSFTLKDIHNYISTPLLSKSVSTINVKETERKNSKIKRMIEQTKEDLKKNIKKKVFINPGSVNSNGDLLNLINKDLLKCSSVHCSNKRKSYINYPKQLLFRQRNQPVSNNNLNNNISVNNSIIRNAVGKHNRCNSSCSMNKTNKMIDDFNRQSNFGLSSLSTMRESGIRKQNEYIKIKL